MAELRDDMKILMVLNAAFPLQLMQAFCRHECEERSQGNPTLAVLFAPKYYLFVTYILSLSV
jgi:hypothetical protein